MSSNSTSRLLAALMIDYFTYGSKYNWYEDSIQTGNGEWTKIDKGNLFSWLSQDNVFRRSNFATYTKTANIKTNFNYIIQKDSVFAIKLSSDTVYFVNTNDNRRTDLVGYLSISADTVLTVRNTAVNPAISVKYKLKK